MTYDGLPHVSLLSYPAIRDRLILLDGWSKTYAMTGWRMGYSVWPGSSTTMCASSRSTPGPASTRRRNMPASRRSPARRIRSRSMVAEFDKRRKIVVEELNKLPGVSCITPKGAFYAFPNVKRTGFKAKALASPLLEEAGVATIGGPDFGILGEGYLRLSYANSAENIRKAIERMAEFLAPQGRVSRSGGVGGRAKIE